MKTMPELPKDDPRNKNLEFWNRNCKTPPEFTKKVNQRGGFTSIDAQYQQWEGTAEWGMFGTSWGLDFTGDDFHYIKDQTGAIIEVRLDAVFKYPGGCFPISVDAAYRVGNDTAKKLQTDAITKALSRLGVNADVFLGMYDDNKYVAEARRTSQDLPPAPVEDKPKKPSAKQRDACYTKALGKIAELDKEQLLLMPAQIATRKKEGMLSDGQAHDLSCRVAIKTGNIELATLQLETIRKNKLCTEPIAAELDRLLEEAKTFG